MSDESVSEADCVICAGSAERRQEYFSADYIRIQLRGVCPACQRAFWEAISEPPPPTED